MSTFYQLAYRVGFTPWERAGTAGASQLRTMLAKVEEGRTPPFGRALDLGCGSGSHTVELAERGWDATGIDAVPKALDRARQRPHADRATFLQGDVTDLGALGLPGDVELFLDVGCFHGLTDQQRTRTAAGITALASPSATMLLLAFGHGAPRPLPRGVDRGELTAVFSGWQIADQVAADTSGLPKPLRRTAPQFYVLTRA